MKTIHLHYFGGLRTERGCSDETLETEATTASQLWIELENRLPWNADRQYVKLAINEEFADWDTPICHGDTLAFLPPFAGG